jgi:hypothetical protein
MKGTTNKDVDKLWVKFVRQRRITTTKTTVSQTKPENKYAILK